MDLFPDAETLDQFSVPVGVLSLEVIEEATALADELQQPSTGVMILCVRLEVFGEVADSLAEERDLYFRGSCVAAVRLVCADDFGLPVLAEHGVLPRTAQTART